MPVIIRIDGKSFHTFTRGFNRPFDDILIKSMQETMKYLCENIQGCVLGYTQSDEITLVLIDYQNLNTAAWFDYNIQKCASVSASMATMAFNKFYRKNLDQLEITSPVLTLAYQRAWERGGMFDARVFNVPKEETTIQFLFFKANFSSSALIFSPLRSALALVMINFISWCLCKTFNNS